MKNSSSQNRVQLPDSIIINEARILKKHLNPLFVRQCFFSPSSRREISRYVRAYNYVHTYTGNNCVYLLKTQRDTPKITEVLPSSVNLEIKQGIKCFEDVPVEVARRLVFSFLITTAKTQKLYRGNRWQIFSPATRFRYTHYAANIGIRSEDDHFSIYLNPSALVLLPVANVPYVEAGRTLFKLIDDNNKHLLDKWNQKYSLNHSTYTTHVGFFHSGDQYENGTLIDSGNVRLTRTLASKETILYPTFALRVVATRAETDSLNISRDERKKIVQLSQPRLKETLQWFTRLFPDSQLKVNDRSIPIESFLRKEMTPRKYTLRSPNNGDVLWFPEKKLLFDQLGTKEEFSQLSGLKKYGSYDSNSNQRPFSEISPLIILPQQKNLIDAINVLTSMFKDGYKRKARTIGGDIDFGSLASIFKVSFIMPSANEFTYLESGTYEEYIESAHNTVLRWAKETNRSANQIVIVVIPDRYSVPESEDPYVEMKKIFIQAGLPSQMVEISTLNQLTNQQIGQGYLLWNLALNIYSKLGGKPWTLSQRINDVNCFIGIGFGQSRQANNSLYVGISNIFDEFGQWLSFASDDHLLSQDELESLGNKELDVYGTSSYKLQESLTQKIVANSLQLYATSPSGKAAKNSILHKNGRLFEPEAYGFLQSLSAHVSGSGAKLETSKFALVSIFKNHDVRLYGPKHSNLDSKKFVMQNTVSRGSAVILNENSAVIATTGKSPVRYPGLGTPRPLLIERYVPSEETLEATGFSSSQMYSIEEICDQIMSLTKLHWGAMRDIRLPVSSEYAQRIARFIAKSQVSADILLRLKKLWWL